MPLKVLFVTATSAEAEPLRKVRGVVKRSSGYSAANLDISVLVTGIGSVPTAWNLMHWIEQHGRPDLAINAGIAGSFTDELSPGDVVMPVSDCFADSGIENGEEFQNLYETGLADPDEFPYVNGILTADEVFVTRFKNTLKGVPAITSGIATGSEATRQKLIKKYNPVIETMEGASFFYICIRERIPFFGLRAISNRIETRNRDIWKIQLALDNLAVKLDEVFIKLE
jgi:futalosine hydrolase